MKWCLISESLMNTDISSNRGDFSCNLFYAVKVPNPLGHKG